jgi:lysophospholipase L1-like esterase
MTILAVGDSFTFGAELPGIPALLGIFGNNHNNQQIDPSPLAWPQILADRLEQPLTNLGLVGGSNSRIFRRTIQACATNTYDLVVCAWTSLERMDLTYHGKECTISAGNPIWPWAKSYYSDHYTVEHATETWLAYILGLQSYFKQHRQQYIFVNAVNPLISKKYNQLVDQIDFAHYLDWNSSFQTWTQGLPRGPGGHFLEEGHRTVAQQLFEFYQHLKMG